MSDNKILAKIRDFHHDTDGPTSVEYAVMLALILGVCITAVQLLATKTGASFDNSAKAIGDVL